MTRHSHSKLGTFQQCKYKYKLQYVDKVKVAIPDTVETFMGKLVHEVLEKLFKDLQYQKVNTKKELLALFEEEWEKRWEDTIIVAKKDYTPENYKEMGENAKSDKRDYIYKHIHQKSNYQRIRRD